ncbi:hypothetical protein HZA33_03600 [Candidatus Pacearchaeota archaeon]|nr:hypothetical protein [Candidatus Pacearchaeota archaeon]
MKQEHLERLLQELEEGRVPMVDVRELVKERERRAVITGIRQVNGGYALQVEQFGQKSLIAIDSQGLLRYHVGDYFGK